MSVVVGDYQMRIKHLEYYVYYPIIYKTYTAAIYLRPETVYDRNLCKQQVGGFRLSESVVVCGLRVE